MSGAGYRVPWPLVGAPGYCYDIDGNWRHQPGSCEFCEAAIAAPLPLEPTVLPDVAPIVELPARSLVLWPTRPRLTQRTLF